MATLALGLTLAWGADSSARGADAAAWRFEPAQAPPPPSGVRAAPYTVPVGQVGEISFWAPNRGLLITGGAGPVPSGLYAYNGEEWHQLSTVCGGSEGRIAWAGPDEFWTISDQRVGQLLADENSIPHSTSLCHFRDGEVVGSYAEPLEQPNSYMPMDAAACYGPNDCWFGGQEGLGSNGTSSFHLHWNGSTLTAVYEPESGAIEDMAGFGGQLYESIRVRAGEAHPPVLHTVARAGTGPSFEALPIFHREAGKAPQRLPEYGEDANKLEVQPAALGGFSFGSDASPLGGGGTQLWLAANPGAKPQGSGEASLTVLRYDGSAWSQVPLGSQLQGETLAGAARADNAGVASVSESIAPEPGIAGAWLSLTGSNGGARVAFLQANGNIARLEELPSALEPEPVGGRGSAGPIVCPAAHDCWMATTGGGGQLQGWLFHLSDEATRRYPRDTDPNFNGLIASRPFDEGVPVIYPNEPPPDDSLANQQQASSTGGPPSEGAATTVRVGKPTALMKHVHTRLLHHRTIVLSFTLTARARVQLIARRHRAVVAKTRPQSLRPGRHQLMLSLDPRRWPTAFQFKATPLGGQSASGAGSEEVSAGDTVST